MDAQIKQYIQAINKEIATKRYGDQPRELYEPISYLMDLGGKRMRPLLTVLAYTLNKKAGEEVIPAALTVEIFHNFTLMHDDIMDQAPLRRGEATVHEKWNEPIAILSGDVMLVKAYEQIIAHCPPEHLKMVLEKFNRCAAEVCEGQQHDMNFETLEEVSIDQYLDMIRQKTAVLLAFSLELGGILSGSSSTTSDSLYEIGIQIGLGFQLMDDILDVYADQAQFGKQVGGDIISNKKTFLLLKAIELVKGEDATALQKWIAVAEFDKKEKVEAVKAIYEKLGIRERAENMMQHYFDKGFASLEQLEGEEQAKVLMRAFFNYLINREK
ncbi:MAG: geranylgeranyl diphosphate synthase type II [Marivirga sp.]|jgi:geranylgeranyl diphosphate synthase type II